MFVSCVGFVVLSVQCYFAIFSDLYCCIAYDEATGLGNVPLCLNFQGFKVSNKQTLSWGNNILVCVDIFKFVKFQHSSSLAFTYLNILFYKKTPFSNEIIFENAAPWDFDSTCKCLFYSYNCMLGIVTKEKIC